MKIQLERNLRSESGKLRCTVCERSCYHGRVRTLLCRDNGAVIGDICADCLNQTTGYIQKRLHQRAAQLINQPATTNSRTPSPQKQALELAELAHQSISTPHFSAWWGKRIAILTAEIRELKLARTGATNRQLQDAKSLKVGFLNEEPSIGKDN